MSPASKRPDLPVFSANGMIPFAPTSQAGHQGASAEVKNEEHRQDLWDIPDTPAR
jgi:histone deacetylase HOS3